MVHVRHPSYAHGSEQCKPRFRSALDYRGAIGNQSSGNTTKERVEVA